MKSLKALVAASVIAGLLAAGSAFAQQDPHHPEGAPKAQEPAPQAKGGMGMMGMDHMVQMRDMCAKMMASGGMNMQATPGDTGAASQAFTAANMKMHQAMSFPMSGEADVDFAKGMIAHHQGAIDMAKVALQYGKDAKMRKLAEDIIKAQEPEIALMTEWLKGKGK